jgi:membrane protease YdiL (CAAX protease family)
MLDPTWPGTPLVLGIAFVALVALLVVRAIRRDRLEYQRFTRFRTTRKRQAMYAKWLRDSALTLGATSLVLLVLAAQFVGPLLTELQGWLGVEPWIGWVVVVGVIVGGTVLTVLGARAVRGTDELVTLGNIRALIPRNRQEVRLGWALSLNAGLSEELLFRLALPAVVYGATGIPELAVLLPVLMFGALHAYQGPTGVATATVMGTGFLAAYVVTGSIAAAILLHALIDLRSFVLLPMVAYGAHRIDGREHPLIARPRPAAKAEPADGRGEADAPGANDLPETTDAPAAPGHPSEHLSNRAPLDRKGPYDGPDDGDPEDHVPGRQ